MQRQRTYLEVTEVQCGDARRVPKICVKDEMWYALRGRAALMEAGLLYADKLR